MFVFPENADVEAYDTRFFANLASESRESANHVVPLLLDLFHVRSLLDLGCGEGAWAAAFLARGVSKITGVDGDYIDPQRLLIPIGSFHPHDLKQPLDLARRFDLAICLEVGEHLPAHAAGTLVATLVRHADLVVFSAAIPGQGGTNHLNEQWPTYWVDRFAQAGYDVFDVLRPRLWTEDRIGFWFRQNLLVFATGAAARHVRSLSRVSPQLDVVHPEQFTRRNEALAQVPPIRTSLHQLWMGTRRKLSRWRRRE